MPQSRTNVESAGMVEIGPGVLIAKAALRYRFARSSGPGGQNVNKLNTKATLIVSLDDLGTVLDAGTLQRLQRLAGRHIASRRLRISSDSSRSQLANRRACLTKLRRLITRALVRPRTRKPTRPSAAAVKRRLDQKTRRSKIKRLRQQRPAQQ